MNQNYREYFPMSAINLHNAKTHLSRLVEAAASGQEVVIAKHGRPVAKLVPLAAQAPTLPRIAASWPGLRH